MVTGYRTAVFRQLASAFRSAGFSTYGHRRYRQQMTTTSTCCGERLAAAPPRHLPRRSNSPDPRYPLWALSPPAAFLSNVRRRYRAISIDRTHDHGNDTRARPCNPWTLKKSLRAYRPGELSPIVVSSSPAAPSLPRWGHSPTSHPFHDRRGHLIPRACRRVNRPRDQESCSRSTSWFSLQ